MERKWWQSAVVYQIYPRSFMDSNGDGVGDLRGIISRLDYLRKLGVDVIWLSPVYRSPNRDNGYDISDYQDIMEEFGTLADFDELLQEAHSRNIRIVMDLVVNHTSSEHPWFQESRKSKDNPFRDYYIWKDPKDGHEPTNWASSFGGSAWQYDETTGQYYLHQFAVEQPDLNWENEEVRKAVYEMMTWWCDRGIDGFRMDVISMISKPEKYLDQPYTAPGQKWAPYGTTNGPHIHEYLKEMNQKVLCKYDLLTVGEAPGVGTEEAIHYASLEGTELCMIFQFEHMGLDDDPQLGKWSHRKLSLPDLKANLSKWQDALAGKAWNSLFWDNHDQPRIVSRWGNDSEPYRVLSAKMMATCLHMMQGTPYIYQGEELGMVNADFSDLSECRDIEEINMYHELVESRGIYSGKEMLSVISSKGRDNARTPMQWDDTKYAGFSDTEPWIKVNPRYVGINAKQALSDPNSLFYFYRELIRLRHEMDVIVYGKYTLLEPDHPYLFAYKRELDQAGLLVLCNFTADPVEIPENIQPMIERSHRTVISNYPDSSPILRPYEAVVYQYSAEE